MLLEIMKYTDRQLEDVRFEQSTLGKWARKEIQRRKMVGYTDGTAVDRGLDSMGNPKPNPYAGEV